MRKILAATLTCLVLVGCAKREPTFEINGVISGGEGQTLYLEHRTLTGIELEDSVVLKGNGHYKLRGAAPQYPEHYQLRMGAQSIPFAVDSIETITIDAPADKLSSDYSVSGSGESEQIKEVWLASRKANTDAKALLDRYNSGEVSFFEYTSLRDSIIANYKEVATRVIYTNPMSTAAYFALFQQVGSELIFNVYDPEDARAFASVANIYQVYRPEDPRTEHLYRLALQALAVARRQRLAEAKNDTPDQPLQEVDVVGYIDIKLPDTEGQTISLSKTAEGHTTLLCFTSMGANWAPEFNSILKTLYGHYAPRGLRIYQVALDRDQHIWRNVTKQMPWTNVVDADGPYSQYIGLYNIQSLPALYLINKQGDIVLRATSIEELEKAILRELK